MAPTPAAGPAVGGLVGCGELVAACEEVIKSFNPKKVTVDTHAQEQLGDADSATANPNSVFIKQVFYGCVRNKKSLKAFMNQFYDDMAASVLRADYTMYLIMAFLTLFRLEELTFPQYRKFVEAQEADKMIGFLTYIFDLERLADTVKWEWMKVFDLDYIEGSILAPLQAHRAAALRLRDDISVRSSGLAAQKAAADDTTQLRQVSRAQPTQPRSPLITKPRPKRAPVPERIPQQVLVGKAPTYLEKTTLSEIEESKLRRREEERRRTQSKYPETRGPRLHETRDETSAAAQAEEERRAKELRFIETSERQPPLGRSQAPIRMNTAAFLREDSLYKRKQEQEVKIIQAYEAELRDSTEYHRWQTEMKARDVQDRLDQVERVRALAKLSAAEAAEAMERQRRDNAELAGHVKAESTEMRRQRALEAEMLGTMNRHLVREVQEVRRFAPREAEAKIRAERRERGEALRKESEALVMQKETEQARERAEREDRVRQLRALADVHREQIKVFDPTESAGLGLLDEMSLVEMRERLLVNKSREREEEDRRRRAILEDKQARQRSLHMKVANIERIRAAASEANRSARQRRKAAEAAAQQAEDERRNRNNVCLLDTLEERRQERQEEIRALREEDERRKKTLAFSGQGTYAMEEAQFRELLTGEEREIRHRQAEAQQSARKQEETKAVARRVAARDRQRTAGMSRTLHARQAEEVEHRRKEMVEKEKAEILEKKAKFAAHREKARAVRERIAALNPYATAIEENARMKRVARTSRENSCPLSGVSRAIA